MRFWLSVLVLFVVTVMPCLSGCGPRMEDEAPVTSSDTDDTVESPVNDADNP
jgi:hypothetical protein